MNTDKEVVRSTHGMLATVAWEIDGHVTYALEGSVFVAGAAVQWLRDGLSIVAVSSETESLALSVPDTGGVVVVPVFTGLGAPEWDMYARGHPGADARNDACAHRQGDIGGYRIFGERRYRRHGRGSRVAGRCSQSGWRSKPQWVSHAVSKRHLRMSCVGTVLRGDNGTRCCFPRRIVDGGMDRLPGTEKLLRHGTFLHPSPAARGPRSPLCQVAQRRGEIMGLGG